MVGLRDSNQRHLEESYCRYFASPLLQMYVLTARLVVGARQALKYKCKS